MSPDAQAVPYPHGVAAVTSHATRPPGAGQQVGIVVVCTCGAFVTGEAQNTAAAAALLDREFRRHAGMDQ